MSGKWLELLKEIAPEVTRVGIVRDPDQVSGGGQVGAISAVAPMLRMEFTTLGAHDAGEIDRAISTFALKPNGGLVVTTSALAQIHRRLIVALAARHRLPAVYPYRLFATGGGLMSYGPDLNDQYRRAAGYVDRILKGEKPADLPVQAAEQVRAGHQPQDREGTWSRSAGVAAGPRRRGDRVAYPAISPRRLRTAGSTMITTIRAVAIRKPRLIGRVKNTDCVALRHQHGAAQVLFHHRT